MEKIIKRESRVVVANGRTGGDREVPNNRLGERKICGLATANPERRDRLSYFCNKPCLFPCAGCFRSS